MNVADLLAAAATALTQKKQRRTENRAQLDALVYVNLRGRELHPAAEVVENVSPVARLG